MQDKKKIYSLKNIAQALGVLLVFLCAVVALSPATRLWVLGYGVYYVFGQVGYWVYLPFLILLGIVIAIKGTLKKTFLEWNVYVGYFFLSLGLLALLSQLAFEGKEDVTSVTLFTERIANFQGNNASALFFNNQIGGGIAGYFLSAAFLMGGAALLWSLAIFLLILGVFLCFFPLWKRLFFVLVRATKTSLAKRKSRKETARLKAEAAETAEREKRNAPIETSVETVSNEDESPVNAPRLSRSAEAMPAENKPVAPAPPEEDLSHLSRAEIYGEKRPSPMPEEIAPTPGQMNHPFVSPSEMAHSGLQEAVFVPDETPSNANNPQVAPIMDTTTSAPETGVHSNEIPTPDELNEAEPPEVQPSPSPTHSNEIVPPYKAAPTPASAPSVTPVVKEETPTAPNASPSFVFTPAPSLKKEEAPVEAQVIDLEDDGEESNEIPTPLSSRPEKILPAEEKASRPLSSAPAASSSPSPTPTSNRPSPSYSFNIPAKTPSNAPSSLTETTPSASASVKPAPVAAPAPEKPTPTPTPAPAPAAKPTAPAQAPVSPLDQCNQPKAQSLPPYRLPSLDLLKTYPANANADQMKIECQQRAATINQALTDLGAGAQVVGFTIGPSVTRFDIQTDKDVSVGSLGRYVQDISVRLNGVATRFEEVVRGKSTSGLEIANSTTTTVSLREMVESLPKGDKYNLYIPFGKSISGECISADLSEFPHLLVSGSTGSGKSIFMHGLIMSLIMRNRPEELKLVVVDPKRVEMGKYKDLPHLLCPIIKEPSQAKVCFQKLIDEMERRYTLFELSGVSNIRQFNSEYAPEAGFAKLPFIVVVVDEYADLVDTCKDIGDGVVRLAQKARAAGIHLVIATQRPSVQVITGVIKANLPVRVALSVSSAVDSMTILGQGGAEDLAGHGDMLVDCSLVARNGFTRCQGCFVDNKEIKAVVDDIKSQQNVVYDPNFLDLVDHDAEAKAAAAAAPQIDKAELKAKGDDDLYETIKTDIMAQEYTSISRIQRSYGVGFPRAGKIFARLQSEGVVALQPDTASSSKGCRVLLHENPAPSENAGSSDNSTLTLTPNNPYPGGNPQ